MSLGLIIRVIIACYRCIGLIFDKSFIIGLAKRCFIHNK